MIEAAWKKFTTETLGQIESDSFYDIWFVTEEQSPCLSGKDIQSSCKMYGCSPIKMIRKRKGTRSTGRKTH